MKAKICKKVLVFGKVQGVWFRASTQNQAKALGVFGYAKNLPDGSVEVLVIGETDNVERLLSWLWKGSDGCRVDNLVVTDEPLIDINEFKVL